SRLLRRADQSHKPLPTTVNALAAQLTPPTMYASPTVSASTPSASAVMGFDFEDQRAFKRPTIAFDHSASESGRPQPGHAPHSPRDSARFTARAHLPSKREGPHPGCVTLGAVSLGDRAWDHTPGASPWVRSPWVTERGPHPEARGTAPWVRSPWVTERGPHPEARGTTPWVR